jgi:hypothetical protein
MCSAGPDGSFDEALADALELGEREVATLASAVDGAICSYRMVGTKLVRDGDPDGLRGEFAKMRSHFADGLDRPSGLSRPSSRLEGKLDCDSFSWKLGAQILLSGRLFE